MWYCYVARVNMIILLCFSIGWLVANSHGTSSFQVPSNHTHEENIRMFSDHAWLSWRTQCLSWSDCQGTFRWNRGWVSKILKAFLFHRFKLPCALITWPWCMSTYHLIIWLPVELWNWTQSRAERLWRLDFMTSAWFKYPDWAVMTESILKS